MGTVFIFRSYYLMENLFNDAALSENMNLIINQNNELVFSELRVELGNILGRIFHKAIYRFFDKIPYRQLFLE